jgi:hypothetical protein
METGSSSSTAIPKAVLPATTATQYAITHQRQPRLDRIRRAAQAATNVRIKSNERSRSGADLAVGSYHATSKNEAASHKKYNPRALRNSLLSVERSTSDSAENASLSINHDIWKSNETAVDKPSSPITALPLRFLYSWRFISLQETEQEACLMRKASPIQRSRRLTRPTRRK